MLNNLQALPNLKALAYFEAAGRLQSFTLAALELNVTQGAVSRQIRLLEENLGAQLFSRGHRYVELTRQGRAYHRAISMALGHIIDASNELTNSGDQQQLVIGASNAVSMYWLMPRLAELRALVPQMDVQILSFDTDIVNLRGQFDIGIQFGRGKWRGFRSQLLGLGEIIPVCSPTYLASHPGLEDPQQLKQADLLHLDDERWNWVSWPVWFRELGVSGPFPKPVLRANSYSLLNKAALDSQGIALGWRYLSDEHIANGWLQFACTQRLITREGFYLVAEGTTPLSTERRLAWDWIQAEFAASDAFPTTV
jgi:LysR family glycine cleavage system transcriptional activator